MPRSCRSVAALLAALALVSAGCGPKIVKVSGKLVKNGLPQTFAEEDYVTISFRPEKVDEVNGITSYAATINRPAGTYEVSLPAGKYHVNVFVPPKGFAVPDAMSQQPAKSMPPPAGDLAGGPVHDIKGSMTLDLPIP